MAPLPPYLLNAYAFQATDEEPAVLEEQLHPWIGSSLAEEYVRYQLNRHRATLHGQSLNHNTPSLSSCAVGSILHYLESSEDLWAEVKEVYQQEEPLLLRKILNDPRISYQILRTFSRHPEFTTTTPRGMRTVVDIDEAVIRNERYIHTLTDIGQRNKYLVYLKDLCSTVPFSTRDEDSITLVRKEPPKGGFEFLNAKRKRELKVRSSEASFSYSFSGFTKGALRGLDWCHVIVAGGVALASLLKVSDMSRELDIYEPSISLYVHGLEPDAANRKLHEIHDIWASNLSPSAQKLVVKSVRAIDLITDCPERSIRIILKLYPSPIDVLLESELDACAIGFDGSRVFMLPRCARAIETGYSVFTMDLVWGCPREGRRASSINRLFDYAERGFGVRILPSYAQFLEDDTFQEIPVEELHLNDPESDAETDESDEEETQQSTQESTQTARKTYSKEPGLKELKRVARLAEGYVRQLYLTNRDREASRAPLFEQTISAHDQTGSQENAVRATHINLSDLDGAFPRGGSELSDGRGFEVLMRYCEVWRLYARGKANFDMSSAVTAPLYDHPNIDDDWPEYKWHENIDIQEFADNLEAYNAHVWENTKTAICSKLGILRRDSGFMNYSTRMVRRVVYGPNLASVQAKQITTPVVVPWLLEDYLLDHLPQQYRLPLHFVDPNATRVLIPLHDPSQHDSFATSIPSLHDTADECGNLRYWVITNQSMWANQHEIMDEFAELMWCIFKWFTSACNLPMDTNFVHPTLVKFDEPQCIWALARYLRHRIILPEVPGDPICSLRQGILFKPWVLKCPPRQSDTNASLEETEQEDEAGEDEGQQQAEVATASTSTSEYPLPNEYDWNERDEGEWIGHDVPAWINVLKRKREMTPTQPRSFLPA